MNTGGQLFHGLNRYYLLVVVIIPKFIFTQYSYQLEKYFNCRNFVNMKVLHGVCYHLAPLCINYKVKEQQYQKQIIQTPELDSPAIMPKFNKSSRDPQPHGRYKRFISTLAWNFV